MNRERGQLTLGLAAAFTMVLAILGLVLRSGLITREKMKLQQTSDFAALTASNYQREFLNAIQETNQAIENDFRQTQAALVAAAAPCTILFAGTNSCPVIELLTLPFLNEITEGEKNSEHEGNGCGCQDYDSNFRNRLIKSYNQRKTDRSAKIISLISKANDFTFTNAVLDTFLNPNNLPLGLQKTVVKKYGSSTSTEFLKNKYIRGELEKLFVIDESSRAMPLFQPKLEIRTFAYWKQSYAAVGVGTTCACILTVGRPSVALTTAKVVRGSDYNTSYLTGAQYASTGEDGVDDFNLFIRNTDPDKNKFGKARQDMSGKKYSLFQKRLSMAVLSLAKPFGGTFAEEDASAAGLVRGGPVGKQFTGAKLIGLADRDQVGVDLPLGGTIPTYDAEGNQSGGSQYYKEDYLH